MALNSSEGEDDGCDARGDDPGTVPGDVDDLSGELEHGEASNVRAGRIPASPSESGCLREERVHS